MRGAGHGEVDDVRNVGNEVTASLLALVWVVLMYLGAWALLYEALSSSDAGAFN